MRRRALIRSVLEAATVCRLPHSPTLALSRQQSHPSLNSDDDHGVAGNRWPAMQAPFYNKSARMYKKWRMDTPLHVKAYAARVCRLRTLLQSVGGSRQRG